MCPLNKISSKTNKSKFDQHVLEAMEHLHPYTKHRLFIAEAIGILPKNMFTSQDIIDDGILKLYNSDFDKNAETINVKLKLFEIVDKRLDEVFKRESFHKNTISTDTILKDELNKLKEDYTVDGGLDLILNTELNDISYHQGDFQKHLKLYSDNNTNILKTFEIEDLSNEKAAKLIGEFYSTLPFNVLNIVDLHTFGKLSHQEISFIKHIEAQEVERILTKAIKDFKSKL